MIGPLKTIYGHNNQSARSTTWDARARASITLAREGQQTCHFRHAGGGGCRDEKQIDIEAFCRRTRPLHPRSCGAQSVAAYYSTHTEKRESIAGRAALPFLYYKCVCCASTSLFFEHTEHANTVGDHADCATARAYHIK